MSARKRDWLKLANECESDLVYWRGELATAAEGSVKARYVTSKIASCERQIQIATEESIAVTT